MVLDGALADAQVVSDDLVRTSSNHEVHDVAFARRQAGEPLGCRLAPLEKLSRIPDALERASDARQKLVGANGLLQAAPALIAWIAIAMSPWPVIMIAGRPRFSAFSRSSRAIPPMPGIKASVTRLPGSIFSGPWPSLPSCVGGFECSAPPVPVGGSETS
jgi:hypothetical protein